MNKQFVPYEMALILKEKGFNERCVASWLDKKFSFDGKDGVLHIDERYANSQNQMYLQLQIKCLAPLYQQVQDWFREKHGKNIQMQFKPNIKKWDFIVYDMSLNGKEFVNHYKEYYKKYPTRRFDSYEEALMEAIKEALTLI